MRQPSEDDIKGWERLMGSPVLPEPAEELSSTRLRLLIVGSLALGVGLFDLRVDPASTVLGLKLSNLTDNVVRASFVSLLVYILLHFLWLIIEGSVEWRLRLSGYERTYNISGPYGGGKHTTGGPDREEMKTPKQATLYSWWRSAAERIGEFQPKIDHIVSLQGDIVLHSKVLDEAKFNQLKHAVDQLSQQFSAVPNALSEFQLHASLRRFDNWFQFFAASQLWRWLIFDAALPLSVGLLGLFAVSKPWWLPLAVRICAAL